MTSEVSAAGVDYPVVIAPNLLAELPRRFAARYPGSHVVVLTDNRVWDLYGEALVRGLAEQGIEADDIVVPEGETSKSLDVFSGIIEELHHHRFDQESILINLGGGMITDLGGFVAASYRKGVRAIHVPTTLFAQQEAAFSTRAGINTNWSKNFISSAASPDGVYCDTSSLKTLSRRDLTSGLAATLKIAIAYDNELFTMLERGAKTLLDGAAPQNIDGIVLRACQTRLVTSNHKGRELAVPFAHALEAGCRYGGVLHGEAIGWGLAIATLVAERRRLLDEYSAHRILRLLTMCELPPEVPRRVLTNAIDRMDLGESGEMILPTHIGGVTTARPSVADLHEALRSLRQQSISIDRDQQDAA